MMVISGPLEILFRYPASVQPVSPPRHLGSAGGLSGARLWRFDSAQGPLVLRGWPMDGSGRAHIETVHRWLFMTTELGFVPVPILDQTGRTLQEYDGRLWEITPWLAGTADLSRPPAPAHLRHGFAGLAAFHQRLAGERIRGPSHGLQERFEAVSRLTHGGLDRLEEAVASWPRPDAPEIDPARCWLRLARLVAPGLGESLGRASKNDLWLQPCLRDARAEHFLFEADRLSGLVDFGAMGVESVAGDLGRLIGDWLDDDPLARQRALESYEQFRPLDPIETRLISAFQSGTSLLIGERWIRWHFVEDRRFDDPVAVMEGIARSLSPLERLAFQAVGLSALY